MIRTAHRYSTSLTVAFLQPPSEAPGSALNISTAGMFVRTDAPLQRGAVVDFAEARRRADGVEDGLDEARLARSPVADDGHVSDLRGLR